MNLYETTFIVNPQSDDASLDRQVKSITDLITANGGKILKEDRMGTRRLAYEIQGLTQGYYTN
ncbi:MAG: 30S ribosomal protein S6, partial [Planctomycetota bacterium]